MNNEGWKNGSTSAWRRLRSLVLVRDNYQCQIQLPGCGRVATQVHHRLGIEISGLICDPSALISSCFYCNRKIGKPDTGQAQHKTMTQW